MLDEEETPKPAQVSGKVVAAVIALAAVGFGAYFAAHGPSGQSTESYSNPSALAPTTPKTDYEKHIETCCNVPHWMHGAAEKAQCIAWGLAKCVE